MTSQEAAHSASRRRLLKRGALLLTALAAPALTYTGCRAMRCSPDRFDATQQRLLSLPQRQVSFTSVRPWTTPLSWLRVEQHTVSPL